MNTARREPTDFDAWLAVSPDVEAVVEDQLPVALVHK
jgi:hypothetical protein